MTVGEYCNREVTIAKANDSIKTAIDLMRSQHAGTIVIVDDKNATSKPVGILTDRDIVLEVFAKDVDLESVTIGDIMSYDLATIKENASITDVISLMKSSGVRRIPVVDSAGALTGIIASDDVLDLVAEQISGLVGLMKKERKREQDIRS